ncbi:piggyBac transposable element-derived protein 3-like protein [Leptotrombidium deliense]|uniref:PiggyBac transposable element-derived protein 3-like protein n=1 Tax=Leptotrombidium deliense TaxID=299467 RepID=A0A443SSE5_9ACAR|nr:piggyBac transposable element-derived protein 3-like protein [Leptotrombidium deliense]
MQDEPNVDENFVDKNGNQWYKTPVWMPTNDALNSAETTVDYNSGLQVTLLNRLQAFQHFCDNRFVNCILNATNERAFEMSAMYQRAIDALENSDTQNVDQILVSILGSEKKALFGVSFDERLERFVKLSQWKPFEFDEICGIIGFVLLMGVRKQRLAPIREALSVRGTRIFSFAAAGFATTRNRFWQFCRFFSASTVVQQREAYSASNVFNKQMSKIFHITQIVLENNRKCWKPFQRICVDEQMVGFRGRTKMKQYMQNKPDKYGLKIWTLADEKNFVFNFQLYTGKRESFDLRNITELNNINTDDDNIDAFVESLNENEMQQRQQQQQQRVRELGISQRVVLDMVDMLPSNHHTTFHLTTDRFFTSLALSNELSKRNITLLGTIDSRKREIPAALKSIETIKRLSAVSPSPTENIDYWELYAFNDRNTLLSYKTNKAKKITHLFSSYHHDSKTEIHSNHRFRGTNKERKRPKMIVDYNQSKGFVDNCNKMLKYYTCQRIYRKWTLVYTSRLIDICALNAYTCWNFQRKSLGLHGDSRYKFIVAIAMGLIANHAKRVYDNPRTPQRRKRDIEIQFSLPRAPNALKASSAKLGVESRRYRCQLCPSKKNKKTRYACRICDNFVCVTHATISYIVECAQCSEPYLSPSLSPESVSNDVE